MDRLTRTALLISAILLALLILSLSWSRFGWTPRIWQFNAHLQQDAVLASYPYQFRALLFVNGVLTLTSPHADQMPLEPFLRTIDPILRDKPDDDPAVRAAAARFAEQERYVIRLLRKESDVDSVVWSLDRAWLREHGLPVPHL